MATRRRINGKSSGNLLPMKGEGRQKMILVPFIASKVSSQIFEPALKKAKEISAELILLCVRPPTESMNYAEEDEALFTDLKGLQAQLHNRAIDARIETVVGPVAQFVLDYADRNETDMILIPDSLLDASGQVVKKIFPSV